MAPWLEQMWGSLTELKWGPLMALRSVEQWVMGCGRLHFNGYLMLVCGFLIRAMAGESRGLGGSSLSMGEE